MDLAKAKNVHWKLFNRLAKLVGWCFFFGGLIGFLIITLQIFDPDLYPADQDSSQSFDGASLLLKLFSLIVPSVVCIFGVLLIKAKPYFPK